MHVATTDTGFVETICANPDDVAVRLIHADWLEEHGQEKRAEFIRLQCREPSFEEPGSHERDLLTSHWRNWCGPVLREYDSQRPGCLNLRYTAGLRGEGVWIEFRCGWVERVLCTSPWWDRWGPPLVRSQPIRRLTTTDLPERIAGLDVWFGDWKIKQGLLWARSGHPDRGLDALPEWAPPPSVVK